MVSMPLASRPPSGPRGALGAAAESAAADHLLRLGWTVLARNLRVGRDEIDIVALEPGSPPTLVVVEVRSRSRPGFGSAVETVDRRKVARLYRALAALPREGHPRVKRVALRGSAQRVDLLTLRQVRGAEWRVEQHLRGLHPP